ncbi:hypothetical protein AQ842_06910 [Burkholderia pseudomallei]|nr:hypothetical protein AQ821_05305 [Burkholderia pseudomallei]OMX27077.1 hypothetical protein AQ823_11460 [Burkholderia pseudomallei]OMX84619.1 hypothetical protein AQ834_18660 [Burkholderia pseudomallei]OMY07307.1 hypothetical protein AQ836_11070 [Burkholderia pseudomallei]OMY27518.1 hypothetical protein AQ842_06910 [Burkholderia pseudomallei]
MRPGCGPFTARGKQRLGFGFRFGFRFRFRFRFRFGFGADDGSPRRQIRLEVQRQPYVVP